MGAPSNTTLTECFLITKDLTLLACTWLLSSELGLAGWLFCSWRTLTISCANQTITCRTSFFSAKLVFPAAFSCPWTDKSYDSINQTPRSILFWILHHLTTFAWHMVFSLDIASALVSCNIFSFFLLLGFSAGLLRENTFALFCFVFVFIHGHQLPVFDISAFHLLKSNPTNQTITEICNPVPSLCWPPLCHAPHDIPLQHSSWLLHNQEHLSTTEAAPNPSR